ncbi:potassium channel family protein [Cytobacillus sp. S13-E01]|uniref:potassium channel family protein n=1 Tax=Cytobacillus sp. S13-E01 TaxID=3031326 RepID=UPI0023D85084|nr:potassium channel family protein [Cytobacillus sp. S13-E01]MDF0725942.1 potassium channel family protein [Cytobacillus sp. S13-E01]
MFLLSMVIVGLVMSVKSLFTMSRKKNQYISLENIIFLCLIYVTVLLGFGLIYTVFVMKGVPVLLEGDNLLEGHFIEAIQDAMYFSAITLLSVGYGDITPVGIGRWLAIVEALLGYIMPTAFVVRTVISYERD